MHPARLTVIVIACFGVGAIAGWQLKPHDPAPIGPAQMSVVAREVPAVVPNVSSKPNEAVPKNPEPQLSFNTFQSGNPSLAERLAMLRWLKANGIVFSPLIFKGDYAITHEMALFYCLTPRETEQLTQAAQQTKKRLDELYQKHVQLDVASNSEKLIVTIPPFPDEGGKMYNDLLASYAAVLGKERYAVFNESGDQLENAFENFGTARTRYEVSLQQIGPDGRAYYSVTRSHVFDVIDYSPDGGGIASGTSSSTMGLTALRESYPLLQSYTLPTVSQKPR